MGGWVQRKLVDVCTLQRGFDLPKRDRQTGEVPLMSSSGCIDFHDAAKVKGPGVVTGRSGSIGQVFFIEKDFWPLNTALYVKDFHGNDQRFISYLLKNFELSKYVSGAGVPTLNRNHVHNELVCIPVDVKEQKHIVAILDQAFADIEQARVKTEQNLKNARELFESYLQQVFSQRGESWVDLKMGDICLKIQDGAHHSPKRLYLEKGVNQFLYITSKNIRNNYMDLTKVQYVDADFHETIYPRCTPELGDVLLTKDGANTGNVTQNTLDEPFSLLSSVCLIKTNRIRLNPAFLKYYIQSPMGFESMTGQMTGTAIKRIILRAIKASIIPTPPIDLQESLVCKFDNLLEEAQKLEAVYSKKLYSLDELKKSILQKAFSGELTKDSKGVAA